MADGRYFKNLKTPFLLSANVAVMRNKWPFLAIAPEHLDSHIHKFGTTLLARAA